MVLISLAEQIISSLGAFFIVSLLAKNTSLTDFSIFSLGAWLLYYFLGVQQVLITYPLATKLGSHLFKDINQYYNSILTAQFLLGIILAFATSIFLFSSNNDNLDLFSSLLTGVYAFSVLAQDVARKFLIYNKNNKLSLFLCAVQYVVILGSLYLLIGDNGYGKISHALIIISFGMTTYYLYVLIKLKFRRLGSPCKFINEVFRVNKHLIYTLGVQWLSSSFAVSLGAYLLGMEALAPLRVSMSIVAIFGVILAGIENYLFPRLCENHINGLSDFNYNLIKKYAASLIVTSGFLILVFIVFGDSIITVLFGEYYLSYMPLMYLMATSAFISSFAVISKQYLVAIGNGRSVFAAYTFAAVCVTPISYFMIVQFELNGIAICMCLSEIILSASYLYFARNKCK